MLVCMNVLLCFCLALVCFYIIGKTSKSPMKSGMVSYNVLQRGAGGKGAEGGWRTLLLLCLSHLTIDHASLFEAKHRSCS